MDGNRPPGVSAPNEPGEPVMVWVCFGVVPFQGFVLHNGTLKSFGYLGVGACGVGGICLFFICLCFQKIDVT